MASQPKQTEEARVPHYAHASTSSKEKKNSPQGQKKMVGDKMMRV